MKFCVICLLIDLFSLCFVVCFVTLGSLSNHDGNGSKNLTQKVNSRCFKLHRSYSNSFNFSNVGELGVESTILDKSPWDSTAIFIFFCHFSVPPKTVHSFRNFLAVLPPPPYIWPPYIWKLFWNSEKILDTRVQHCLLGEGRGWTWVNWKTPQKCKSVPRLLFWL